jgi:hypothetical protein
MAELLLLAMSVDFPKGCLGTETGRASSPLDGITAEFADIVIDRHVFPEVRGLAVQIRMNL